MKKYAILVLCSVSTLFGCVGDQCPSFDQNVSAARPIQMSTLSVQSSALNLSKIIPTRYTCEGENVSPDIQWRWSEVVPANIQSYAVLVTSDEWYGVNLGINPRAVDQSHWVVFNIPPTTTTLQEGVSISGSNGTELRKYQGPRCSMITQSNRAQSAYAFTVYALDMTLDPSKIQTKDDLVVAMQGHIVASGTLTKYYTPQQK